jgi:HYR domain
VYDNEKPLLNLPTNIVLGVDEGQNHAVVSYTATASDNSGSVSLVCVPMSGSTFPLGVTTVTCNAIDNAGNVASGSFTITVTNSVVTPVDYGCVTASRSTLWPPQHQMVPVSLWLNYDAMPVPFSSVRVVSITSNEPETGLWADDNGADWEITDSENLKLSLRAERDDNGSGRIYTIWIEGRDARGNDYLCTTTITVPKTAPKKTKSAVKSPKQSKATKAVAGKK